MATPLKPKTFQFSWLIQILSSYDYHDVELVSQNRKLLIYVAPGLKKRLMAELQWLLSDWSPRFSGSKVQIVSGVSIEVLPPRKVANKGVKAEGDFLTIINSFFRDSKNKQLDVEFTDGSHRVMIRGAVSAEEVGKTGLKSAGKGTGKKADFQITDKSGKVHLFSLKSKTGDQLASYDGKWKHKARKVIDWVLANKETRLAPGSHPGSFMLVRGPNSAAIAIPITNEELLDAAFGTDLVKGGFILKGELDRAANFKLRGNTLVVTCKKVYGSISDFTGDDEAWVQIRNEAKRNTGDFIPGLRITVVTKKNLRGTVERLTRAERSKIGI